MESFRDISASSLEIGRLKEEMDIHGYVMIRRLLPVEELSPLLGDINGVLLKAGWLKPNTSSFDRIANVAAECADGDRTYKGVRNKVFRLQSFHALPHHPLLLRVMKLLVGERLLIHPKSEVRLIWPNFERGVVHAHQDHTAIAGDEESFTAWIALHDCPLVQGPLRVLDGSHRFGLLPTVGQTGYISRETEGGCNWVEGDIRAGDVLLFHSLTVHEAVPNRSRRFRISLDCRFQSYERVIDPGAFVFTGAGERSWENTYASWTADATELKYYWTKLPLRLKPSKAELADLARTCESTKMRERYGRIVERLESQRFGVGCLN